MGRQAGHRAFGAAIVTALTICGVLTVGAGRATAAEASAHSGSELESTAAKKIWNLGSRPLAAGEGAFLRVALAAPKRGGCEVVSPDPGFREEMLLDVERLKKDGERRYQRRVALVVGNGAYREPVKALPNPPNDATSMARMFMGLGFTVYRAIDASEAGFNDCFAQFKADLESSDRTASRSAGRASGEENADAAGEDDGKTDIALFFYAGHGVQLTSTADNVKRNYMMSVDASVDANGKAKGFRQVDAVLNEMRAHSKQAVFLYDACRDSPYEEGTIKEADGRPVRFGQVEGPAPVEIEEEDAASQAGLFIAYATSPGKTADDDWGPQGSTHSPFTEALLKNLPTPGDGIEEALVDAYFDVRELTDGQQTPWTSSSLTERVRLNGAVRSADIRVRAGDQAARGTAQRDNGRRVRGNC